MCKEHSKYKVIIEEIVQMVAKSRLNQKNEKRGFNQVYLTTWWTCHILYPSTRRQR